MLFRKICKHDYKNLGMFYKEIFTEYRNDFDLIDVYRKERCELCGKIQNVEVSSEMFLPELYKGRDFRKDRYLEHLINKGIKLEVDL